MTANRTAYQEKTIDAMAINLEQIINSQYGIQLVSALGRAIPLRLGYRLADFAAGQIARRRNSNVVLSVRANQWVVRGETLDQDALDRAVQETFRHTARSIFELYHFNHDLQAAQELIVLDPSAQQLIPRLTSNEQGLLVVGLHISNFDLVLQWLCQQWNQTLVLTIPDPQGGRRVEYEKRREIGMNLVPASVSGVRQALRVLQQGGIVATGIDRPIPEPGACPRFFGRPAALPMHHIFLATKAHVPLVIMVPIQQPDGKYHVLASDLIEMDAHPIRETGAIQNAEKVLNIAEEFIRQSPGQWTMSLPVWPQVLKLVPQ
jgi:KDO2-lipid IV(A) lauroyltransferase